jgi:hypothetical protein
VVTNNTTQAGKCAVVPVHWQAWIFTRLVGYIKISPGCLPMNLNFYLEWGKNLERRHTVQKSHFCSRKHSTDTTFFGKWWFVH